MTPTLVAIIVSTVIVALAAWITVDIITAMQDAKDMREQIECFYNRPNPDFVPPPVNKPKPSPRIRTVMFDEESGDLDIEWRNATGDEISACMNSLKGNGEMDVLYDDCMWAKATEETQISIHSESRPSCKCSYCGCTNDHIYGTCDYCGAPLEG